MTDRSCPHCAKPLKKVFSRKRNRYYFRCDETTGCGAWVPIGKDGNPVRHLPAIATVRCPKCAAPMRYVPGAKYGDFWSCSRHPDCTGAIDAMDPALGPVPDNLVPFCPEDSTHGRMKRRSGVNGAFFGCVRYPTCTATIQIPSPPAEEVEGDNAVSAAADGTDHNPPLARLALSPRALRTLRAAGIEHLSDIAAHSAHEILGLPGAGPSTLAEAEAALNQHGLTFGMRRRTT